MSRHLQATYGDKISIRSAIVFPPTAVRRVVKGREVVSFTGKGRFTVVDQRDKDFGMHQFTYVIQDNQLVLLKEEP